jgi:hypothetical protein
LETFQKGSVLLETGKRWMEEYFHFFFFFAFQRKFVVVKSFIKFRILPELRDIFREHPS